MRLSCCRHRELSQSRPTLPSWLQMGLLAAGLVAISFAIQGMIDLSLADEGFLWYGTWRTSLGEVPLRDFQSYDPGRYLWGAFWFRVFNDHGVLALRLSSALFQIIGLACGLLVLRRLTRSLWWLTSGGIVLLLWMLPWYKSFESSLAMAAVATAVWLTENPSLRRHFLAGTFVGVAAFFGRQHGFYAAISFFALIGFLWLKGDRRRLIRRWLVWIGGVIAGYSPMLAMFATVPGFWNGFLRSLSVLARTRSTNLPLPIPTLWSVLLGESNWLAVGHKIGVALGFAMLPLFSGAVLLFLLKHSPQRLRSKSVLIGAAFLSFTYIHYAFSRADLSHLAHGIAPALLGLMAVVAYALRSGRSAWGFGLALGLAGLTMTGAGITSPAVSRLRAPDGYYAKHAIREDRLSLPRPTAEFVETVRAFCSRNVPPDEGILLAPFIPTLYPILGRRSPIWDIYFLFPETEERQQQMIDQLRQQNVNWIILGDRALDGRPERRFRNTHPLIWKEFSEHFESIKPTNLPEDFQILHRRH